VIVARGMEGIEWTLSNIVISIFYHSELVGYKEFLMEEYNLSEKSASDYVARLNGILDKGIYNGEQHISPYLEAAIEKEFEKSRGHYVLALKRYIYYKNRVL